MSKRARVRWQFCLLLLVAASFGVAVVTGATQATADGEELVAASQKPLAKPPEGQTYVGVKDCAACHLDQFLDWKGTKHAKAFEILPAKYRTDKSCLKCHTTGYGEEGGFKTLETTPGLVAATCESCHGPGSKHSATAKQFGNKKLNDEEKKYVASTIYKMQPRNVCVDCHLTRAHKKHPPYDKQ